MMLTEPVAAAVPFEQFIEHLRRNGFVIGVDCYLRIQELLERVGGAYGPADLKTLVCPLVARSDEEQEAFYAAFRKFYPGFELQLEAAQLQSAVAPLTAPVVRKRQKWALAAFLAVAVVAMLVALFVWNTQRTVDPVFPVLLDKKQEAPQEPAPTPRPVDTPTPPVAASPPPPIDRFNALGGWRVVLPLLALLVWLALELAFRRRRKLILARRQGLKPPSMWPLRTESQPFSFRADALFHSVSRRLQDRKPAPAEQIDIPRSVQATIRSLGFPVFVRLQATQIPEYIVLIDRSARQDHQAQFFSDLVDSLEQEGVLIRRYFFDEDPRECWSDNGADRFSLSDLPSGGEHRLLLCTVGSRLVDPYTGQVARWVDLLERWTERAILTPVPFSDWGPVERKLASSTVLLPGSLGGIHAFIDHLEAEDGVGVLPVLGISAVPELSSSVPVELLINQLQAQLGTDAFTWLCACAVYPELHWDLTLEIAALPYMPGGLLSEDNLIAMIRLPWLRTGSMPDDLRSQLISYLSVEQELEVRRCILRFIEANPAPDNTIAREQQRDETAVGHEWLVALTHGAACDGSLSRGYVALSKVEPGRLTRLDLLLPKNLRYAMTSRAVAFSGASRGRFEMLRFYRRNRSTLNHQSNLKTARIPRDSPTVSDNPPGLRSIKVYVPWMLAGVGVLAICSIAIGLWKPLVSEPLAIRTLQKTAMRATFTTPGGNFVSPVLSRDGTKLLYLQLGIPSRLWVRMMDQLEGHPIPGTEGAEGGTLSPDGNWIAFFKGPPPYQLAKIPVIGGSATILATIANFEFTASWTDDGWILAGSQNGLVRVAVSGGRTETLTIVHRKRDEIGHFEPVALPGGRGIIFTIGRLRETRIAVLDLKTDTYEELQNPGSTPNYVPTGHLVYRRGPTLFALPFDVKRLRVTGAEVAVLEGLALGLAAGAAPYTFSPAGLLVYRSGNDSRENSTLAWMDRKGVAQGLPEPPHPWQTVPLSPDGRKIVAELLESSEGSVKGRIWIYDTDRGTLTPLTSSDRDYGPIWTPDGRSITFSSNRGGDYGIYRMPIDSSRQPELLLATPPIPYPYSWAPDGKTLLYYLFEQSKAQIYLLPLNVDGSAGKPFRFHPDASSSELQPAVSPDGKWIAYTSDHSGRFEIYVSPFPGPGGKFQVSTQGGRLPKWSPNGRELFYVELNPRRLMSAEIITQPSFQSGNTQPLFTIRDKGDVYYDVAPDGKRFLVLMPPQGAAAAASAQATFIVVTNWFDELARRVSSKK